MTNPSPSRAAPLRRELVGDEIHFHSVRGSFVLPRSFGRVFHYRASGHFDAAMVAQIWASFDAFAATRSGLHHAFADYSAVTGYDSDARRSGAEGFRARRSMWDTFHVLLPGGFAAKLVSMGLSAMALASSVPVRCHTDAATFASLRQAHERARAR